MQNIILNKLETIMHNFYILPNKVLNARGGESIKKNKRISVYVTICQIII